MLAWNWRLRSKGARGEGNRGRDCSVADRLLLTRGPHSNTRARTKNRSRTGVSSPVDFRLLSGCRSVHDRGLVPHSLYFTRRTPGGGACSRVSDRQEPNRPAPLPGVGGRAVTIHHPPDGRDARRLGAAWLAEGGSVRVGRPAVTRQFEPMKNISPHDRNRVGERLRSATITEPRTRCRYECTQDFSERAD
jgi:hypothetical protein